MEVRNLMLTGGINHDFIDTAKALNEVQAGAGIQSQVCADIDEGFDALDQQPYNLATMFVLRWRMLDADKHIPFRDEWAYKISDRASVSADGYALCCSKLHVGVREKNHETN